MTVIQKKLELDLSKIQGSKRKEAKDEIGSFVVDETLSHVGAGKSPVKGERFKKLSKEYAEREKGGNRTPNLQLEGDLLDAFGYERNKDGITVGILKAKEQPKADGHNNFSGDSSLPKRRFVPDENQTYNKFINDGVKEIISRFEDEFPANATRTEEAPTPRRPGRPRSAPATQPRRSIQTTVSQSDLLSARRGLIDDLFGEES